MENAGAEPHLPCRASEVAPSRFAAAVPPPWHRGGSYERDGHQRIVTSHRAEQTRLGQGAGMPLTFASNFAKSLPIHEDSDDQRPRDG
jgi:hypothetical protein